MRRSGFGSLALACFLATILAFPASTPADGRSSAAGLEGRSQLLAEGHAKPPTKGGIHDQGREGHLKERAREVEDAAGQAAAADRDCDDEIGTVGGATGRDGLEQDRQAERSWAENEKKDDGSASRLADDRKSNDHAHGCRPGENDQDCDHDHDYGPEHDGDRDNDDDHHGDDDEHGCDNGQPPANGSPTANDQSLSTAEDTARELSLSGSDPERDPLSYRITGDPGHGALAGSPPQLLYTPAANYHGPDSFTFVANDGQSDSSPATVAITVIPVNDPPLAMADAATTAEDTLLTITNVLANDSDPDGDLLAVISFAQPAHGTALYQQDGSFSYRPSPGFTGTDTFDYTISDGQALAGATVTLTVTGSSPLPTANLDNWPPAVENSDGGGMLKLDWSTTNADTVTLVEDGQFDTHLWEVAANAWTWVGTYWGESVTYTLTASNAAGIARSSVTVDYTDYTWSPRAYIKATPLVIQPGQSATLDWYADYADSAVIDQGIGVVPLTSEAGGITVTPTQTTTYTITASDSSALEQATAQITVFVGNTSPTVNATANAANLIIGEPVSLSWETSFADYCLVEPGFGRMAATGHAVARPSADTVYTITAVGPGGNASATIPVKVREPQPEILWASATPEVIQPGGSASLSWSTSYADEVIIAPDLGSLAGEGSLTVSPSQTTVYTITASNLYGSTSTRVTVEVSALGLAFLEPDGIDDVVDGSATINWAASGLGGRPATMSIYYTTTADFSGDGMLIAADLDQSLNTLAWDTTGVPDGSYYIYGVLNDGLSSPLGVYSPRPFTVYHPVVNEQKIAAANLAAGNSFGEAVAISNDWAVVGRAGAANVFRRNGALWEEQATLAPADALRNNRFGAAVAIAGELIAVGAPGDATLGSDSGAVYLFRFDGFTWHQEAKVSAADGAVGDQFGATVAVAGDHLLVGAPYEDSRSTDGGSVYFFHFDGSVWSQIAREIPQWSGEEYFGQSLALDHDRAVVGSSGQGVWYSTANTIQSGAAYVYDFNGSTWHESSRLTSYDSFRDTPHSVIDYFGQAVTVAGDTILVGAPGVWSTSGSVFVYHYTGTYWQKQAQLAPTDSSPGDGFGNAVALDANLAIIGADYRDEWRGGVYSFAWDGAAWQQQEGLAIADPASYDQLGGALAADGGYVIAGAPGQDTLGSDAGSAYIFPVTTIDFTADRELINQGAPVVLNWQTHHADAVSITPGIGAVAANGAITVNPAVTTTYTLTATGARGASSLARTITVSAQPLPLPVIVAFTADSAAINFGERILLTWSVKDATTLTLDNGIGVVTGLYGVTAYPKQTTTYTLTASGPGGTTTAKVTVMVSSSPLPAIDAFSAMPNFINAGELVQLTWSVRNVDTLTIDHGIGDVSGYSSWTVTPQATTTYTLTATGPGGTTTASIMVEVAPAPPPSIDFFAATPSHVTVGGQALLAWSTRNATTLTLDQGVGEVSGYAGWEVMPQATTTYTLTASGPGGATTAVVTVAVEAVVHPAPEVTINLSPATIVEGGIATLTWSCTGLVDNCVIDQGIGPVAFSGSTAVSPIATTVYGVTVTGPGGSVTAAATLTVQPTITLTISEPVAGTTVHVPEILVLGTVTNRFGNETGVTVNGIPAQVAGKVFFANQVSLAEGENLISVKATDINGRIAEAAVTIYLDTSVPSDWLELHLNPDSGLAPFKTTLTVNPHLSFVPTGTPVISSFGPADVMESRISDTEINLEFTVPGVYSIGYETFSPQGQVVSGEVMVNVLDRGALDNLLKAKWEGMKIALTGTPPRLSAAVQDFTIETRDGYLQQFISLYNADGGVLGNVVGDMMAFDLIEIRNNTAIYNLLANQNGTIYSYQVKFIQDEDGLWRIKNF